MDMRSKDRNDEPPTVETPEDVAVLYSWANLHGAKYRDFSASRREYRAQLRHRAAEQAREQELRAQAHAESAATTAERAARQAGEIAMSSQAKSPGFPQQQALREVEDATRVAAAERIEAARRAEAAALAEAAARREEQEIAEANASARRQAAQYADSEVRHKGGEQAFRQPSIPGEISDPYTPSPVQPRPPALATEANLQSRPGSTPPAAPSGHPAEHLRPAADLGPADINFYTPPAFTPAPAQPALPPAAVPVEYAPPPYAAPAPQPSVQPARRPQGYRPDDASGVRQIYRGPDFETPREISGARAARPVPPAATAMTSSSQRPQHPSQPAPQPASKSPARPQSQGRASAWSDEIRPDEIQPDQFQSDQFQPAEFPSNGLHSADPHSADPRSNRIEPNPLRSNPATPDRPQSTPDRPQSNQRPAPHSPEPYPAPASLSHPRDLRAPAPPSSSPSTSDPATPDTTPRRRRQDAPGYKEEHPSDPGPSRRREDVYNAYAPAPTVTPPSAYRPPADHYPADRYPVGAPPARPALPSEPSGPAWLYASAPQPQHPAAPLAPIPAPPQSSVADTLQHSRERVAARWYALKGVFEQPGQEAAEPAPVRQKETRTPVLAVFSMAGGVGKTSLVATLGRSLSSLGEKVLLTDTTSHGLLPFYFGASELRQGTVRTFSPPSGSTDAPIYLVSYDVEASSTDEAAQEALVEEITASSRGTHRVLLDLTVSSSWIVRRMARLSPTILVPVAPDMNSVISLHAVEKFFNGVVDAEGRPLKLFYLLNQFDASLPLHLDVREVLRRQLGDRLLPFVIRRAPAVSEALAEGMTIVDYSPEAPVAEDYGNTATWLRTVSAPATAGFRNVRWSER